MPNPHAGNHRPAAVTENAEDLSPVNQHQLHGLDSSSKRPRLGSFRDEETPAINTSYSLGRVLSHGLGQSSQWKSESQELNPYKDNSGGAGREYLRENWYLDDHAKHSSEEMAAKRSQFLLDERIPLFRHSWETRFSTGTMPPTHISNFTFGPTSWNLDPLSSHKFLEVEREYGTSRSTSLQKTSSPFSGSESGNPFRKLVSADFQHSVGYKTEMPSYSWETSTPFRPSFSLTQSLLSSVNRYNPIRDSMEQYKSGIHVTVITEMQNRIAAPKVENLLGSTHLRDLTKTNTANTENDHETKTEKQKTKSVDMAGQEADVKMGEVKAKETESVIQLRAALIDFVKELVKPTWREGNLSKDAHMMIVKRAVDRVLGTIPSHRIPSTPDSVKLFLYSSEPEIAKFVEYYIDKYRKL